MNSKLCDGWEHKLDMAFAAGVAWALDLIRKHEETTKNQYTLQELRKLEREVEHGRRGREPTRVATA